MPPAAIAPANPAAPKTKPAVALPSFAAKAKAFWDGRTGSQKLYLGLGLAVTVAAAVFFTKMISTPEYKTLMTGMEPADTQTLTAQLDQKKIPYKVSDDATSISVPSDQLAAARLEVASHDTPHSGRIGFEIFDKVSWGETEFDEKVNYQRALEGELERTIQTMSNVKSARVHLVMASDSVFLDRDRPAKASVTLQLRRGSLTREESNAIMHLVAGAVDNLKPEDVALVDADSSKSLLPNSDGGSEDSVEQGLSKRLTATLAPVVGADGIRTTVNVEYDNSSSEENLEKYDPNVSVPLSMEKSEELATGGASGVGGVPGTSSNLPGAKANANANASAQPGQSSKNEKAQYGVNRTIRHTIEPAGRIRRITAAVLVDDAIDRKQEKGKWVETRHKRSPEEMKLIQELAQAAIGFDSARGDVISVQNLGFDHPAAPDVPPVSIVEKTRKGLDDYSSLVRYGVLLGMFLLVYFLMIRPIQKRALAASELKELPAPASSEQAALPGSPEALALRSVALKKQLAEFVRKEPEVSTTAIRAWLREEAL